jgi:hypothetical protein
VIWKSVRVLPDVVPRPRLLPAAAKLHNDDGEIVGQPRVAEFIQLFVIPLCRQRC